MAYDVSADAAREKVARLLEAFGVRVGLSLFEITLARPQVAPLLARIAGLLDSRTDRAQLYPLCGSCAVERRTIGSPIGVARQYRVLVA